MQQKKTPIQKVFYSKFPYQNHENFHNENKLLHQETKFGKGTNFTQIGEEKERDLQQQWRHEEQK